jgi:uracil-DNA glycosylase family 4
MVRARRRFGSLPSPSAPLTSSGSGSAAIAAGWAFVVTGVTVPLNGIGRQCEVLRGGARGAMTMPMDLRLDDEIAALARELQGALAVARIYGTEHLPKPTLAETPASAPPAPRTAPATASAPRVDPRPSRLTVVGDGLDAIDRILRSPVDNAHKLAALKDEVLGECTRCKLHRGRSKIVFGVGNPQAQLCFVGEGPGADEDRQGIPFVGAAGQLLTKMIAAMGFARDDVYICNVVKCRPPNNRDPDPDEVEACEPFLRAQLAIVQPKVIVALGRYAAQTLLKTKTPITKLRGNWYRYEGIDLMPTYHPSYLLREEFDPQKRRKREAWSDLQQVMTRFGKPVG